MICDRRHIDTASSEADWQPKPLASLEAGAFFGAAARPKRTRAVFPDTSGPELGKRAADAEGTINAKTTMPNKI